MHELAGQVGNGPDPSYGNQYAVEKALRMPTLQQRLDQAVRQAEERLRKVKEARDILARNPDLEKLLDIMQQSHF
jgi:hypothetical protein